MMKRRHLLASVAALAVARRAPAAVPDLRLAVAGDCLLTENLVRDDPTLAPILPILRGADVALANFEGTLADRDAWAASVLPNGMPICGGLNIRSPDAVARDLAWMGFDMMGTANNHAWDWGPAGIATTIHKLGAAKLHPAGTGSDLAAARRPNFFAAKGARIALIACAATFWPGTDASRSNADVRGRPGLNPLRVKESSEGSSKRLVADPRDLTEILASIHEARATADLVVVSCHSHEDEGDRTRPPRFMVDFAHACVEAGAALVFSHGPHILRGIEIHHGTPILYGLGCFIFRNNGRDSIPEELFERCDMASRVPEDYLATLSRGWEEDELFWEGGLVELDYQQGQLNGLLFRPTLLQHDRSSNWGMPQLATGVQAARILARVKNYSSAFGTTLEIAEDCARLRL